MTVARCRLIDLPRVEDSRGALTFIESVHHVPFEIKRVYYLYEVPEGQARGAHAHRALEQLFIAIAGSFEISVDDGHERQTTRLSSPHKGLYLPPMMWRDLGCFSGGAVCLVLASAPYDESDYIRDYAQFQEAMRSRGR